MFIRCLTLNYTYEFMQVKLNYSSNSPTVVMKCYFKFVSNSQMTNSTLSGSPPIKGFSQEEKNRVIERLKNFKIKERVKDKSFLKNAAVLIPLCYVNSELSLLYTLRKQDLKIHKGQVSFPGGKKDVNDVSLEATALRETEEELGILKSSIDVWGHGHPVVAREFRILPVIGFIGDIKTENLKPNPSEVDLAFAVPLTHFYEPKNCKSTQYRNSTGYVLPVFINTESKIWGITALITHIVMKALSPKMYVHELSLIKPVP